MEHFPKELISMIALELDDIDPFSKTCKRFNFVVNQDIFWINKLKKDYDIDFITSKYFEKMSAKEYYFDIESNVNYDINNAFYNAVWNDRLDIVKITLNRGADILGRYLNRPIIEAVLLDNSEIVDYLIEKGALKEVSYIKIVLNEIIIRVNNSDDSIWKKKMVYQLYDRIIPAIILSYSWR